MFRLGLARQKRFDRRDKVISYRAANAAIRQFYDIFFRAAFNTTTTQNISIHANVAELVDN